VAGLEITMPDTGAPWNIPYIAPTDNPRVYPAADEAQALAVAAGLDLASKVVTVKSSLKTDVFSSSVSAGDSVAVTGLSITHTVADAANSLILIASFGDVTTSASSPGFGISIAVDGTSINIGDAAGSRPRLGASAAALANSLVYPTFYLPGAGSKVYTVRVHNLDSISRTVSVNRTATDSDGTSAARSASNLILVEVKP